TPATSWTALVSPTPWAGRPSVLRARSDLPQPGRRRFGNARSRTALAASRAHDNGMPHWPAWLDDVGGSIVAPCGAGRRTRIEVERVYATRCRQVGGECSQRWPRGVRVDVVGDDDVEPLRPVHQAKCSSLRAFAVVGLYVDAAGHYEARAALNRE